MTQTPSTFADAREQFLALVAEVRPELHRYCARLTGSVIDGEDIVQDTLAKAFYALSQSPEVPALRPWLFRIAHNSAVDFLKSHARKLLDVQATMDDLQSFDERPDPAVVRAALARFVALPLTQRSVVILKDVLGHSLEETAEIMNTSVPAVKAALVRGRAKLMEEVTAQGELPSGTRSELERYAALFNARDWDGVRALLHEDCRLDLVSKSQRRGKQVEMYFDRYQRESITLVPVRVDGKLALAAYPAGAAEPGYFMLLEFEARRVTSIRDYRYVPYIAREAAFEPLGAPE